MHERKKKTYIQHASNINNDNECLNDETFFASKNANASTIHNFILVRREENNAFHKRHTHARTFFVKKKIDENLN